MGININLLLNKRWAVKIILLSLTAFSIYLVLVLWRNPLNIYDAAGHLSLVQTIAGDLWPKFSGWNYSELLGWPQGFFYPSLFHWLAATLSFIVGIEPAVKLLISGGLLALPLCISFFARSLIDDDFFSNILTLGLFILILLLPNFLGTGIRALFQVGLLSNFFVIPIFFLFLASLHRENSFLTSGFLLALIVLTHIVAAIVAAVYLILFLIIKKRFAPDGFKLVHFVKVTVLALIITSFFWGPFILNLPYTSVSRHLASYFLPNIIVLIVSLGLVFYSFREKNENILLLSTLATLFSLLAVVDAYLIRGYGTSFALYPFHIYRFQPFIYIFLASAITLLLLRQRWFFELGRYRLIGMIFLLGGLGLVGGSLYLRNPAVVPNIKLELTEPQGVKGRFLETFRRTESDPYWYGVQTEVVRKDEKASWAYGLFTDSSPNGPYLGSLIKSLRPEAYPEGDGYLLETISIGEEKAGQLLSYFSINQLINLEKTERKSIARIENEEINYFNVEKASESRIFEIAQLPLKPVETSWDKAVEKWWLKEGEITEIPYLINGKKISEVSKDNLEKASVKVVETSENQTLFELKIDSEKKVPILAKISFFPYWRASSGGNPTPIYRAAPNLMIFEAKGDVVVEYKEPFWINWLYLGSFVGWVVVFGFLTRKLVKSIT
ncbi:hypothetical protein IH981_02795 [Patescibacteria group bacterium]|nr:hypothetical protein [Patescibacteria group bacterium]